MRRLLLFVALFFCIGNLFAQQDLGFQINQHFFAGKNIISVKRDFIDPYLWVLAQNNQVYRINSVTMVIDDFTSAFANYGNFQFIDIAGLNKDTVFMATNANAVVQYKSGNIKLLGSSQGITTVVNSVGIAKNAFHEYYSFDGAAQPVLLIGSDHALYRYDIRAEQLTTGTGEHNTKIYEATFRTQMFRDSTAGPNDYDGLTKLPVSFPGEYSFFTGFLWEGKNGFGYDIKTACLITGAMTDYDIRVSYMNMFWGNKNGLFQNYWQESYYIESDYGHYLEGININKVTNIYGLTAFGGGGWYDNPAKIKQNLLIGTDQGLYFSNSLYRTGSSGLTTFQLFHADVLGNLKVNDICVNVASRAVPLCEDGVWVATFNGLYYLKPDYAQFLGNGKVQAASFKDAPASQQELNICAGNTATATVSTELYTSNSIQWYKNGQQLPGESSRELQIATAGEYHAILYDPCQNIHLETNHLKTTIISSPVFNFNYTDVLAYCDSFSATLTTDYSPAYQYRWLKDGVLTGDASYKMKATTNGKYRVEVSACDGTWVPSKEITVALINLPVPVISADKQVYCEGEQAKLVVNTPLSADYHISWLLDGHKVASLEDKVSATIVSAGEYTVQLSSLIGACTKISGPLNVSFVRAPVFTVDHAGTVYLCEDEALTLKANAALPYQYRWYKDAILTGNTGPTLQTSGPGLYYAEASACENSWYRRQR
ncbi:hypothetical protein E2R66_16825 [Mucilaginibacter psychrotolerans]|uniref:Ig-like domain-containing protein n=2 Tax=Mucilaginibacter psychrotolerans TaxID=1524096 RepID=A0A4Y8SCP3_9SPHI|nr:hypothetical protein E2R66_16825 [Mucilaginibacter psychrotolerans]